MEVLIDFLSELFHLFLNALSHFSCNMILNPRRILSLDLIDHFLRTLNNVHSNVTSNSLSDDRWHLSPDDLLDFLLNWVVFLTGFLLSQLLVQVLNPVVHSVDGLQKSLHGVQSSVLQTRFLFLSLDLRLLVVRGLVLRQLYRGGRLARDYFLRH